MIRLLVVDDSPIDQRLVEGIFRGRADVRIDAAPDGRAALDAVRRDRPDIVLTDLRMPRMDGLGLVEALRELYPSLPVVLMTSHGSEDVAAEALRRGAASYVPKRLLARDLGEILDRLAGLILARRTRTAAGEALLALESRYVLDSDEGRIHPVLCDIRQDLLRVGFADETALLHVQVALQEALCNAIQHGNLEVPSELRARGDEAFRDLLERRRGLRPYCDRRVRLTARLDREQATCVVRDEGPGFDPAALPDPTDPANLDRPFGRGMMLIRTFMDEVAHNATGNEITLVKRRRAV